MDLRFVVRLGVFAFFSAVVVNVVLALLPWTPASGETAGRRGASPLQRVTALQHAAVGVTFFPKRYAEDSWTAMGEAWGEVRARPRARLYEDLFFGRGVKFQYPPTSLLVMEAAGRLAADPARRALLLNGVGWGMLWATAGLTGLIFLRSLEDHGFRVHGRTRAALFVLAAGMAMTFYPAVKAFTLGQIQAWLNAGFAAAVWCWMTGRERWAGVLTGLICAVKPQHGLLLLWGLARRRWGFAGAMCGAGLVVGLVSLGLYGWQNHVDYLDVVRHIGRHGEAFFPNQSVNGLLNRAAGNGNNNEWDGRSFPAYHAVVFYASTAWSLLLVITALGAGSRAARNASVADFMIAVLSFTMASPVAWEHHYGVLLPMFAWLLPSMMRRAVLGRWTLWVLGGAYVVASNFFGWTRNLAGTAWTPVQSYLLMAGVVVLAMLYLARRAEAAGEVAAGAGGARAAKNG